MLCHLERANGTRRGRTQALLGFKHGLRGRASGWASEYRGYSQPIHQYVHADFEEDND